MARSHKEKDKATQEKYQAILTGMLRDDTENKYCVDCEAKGPRWASWNLGIFLCIRCAGIHRNLGVHISRVKSVNLDSWTAEQIESIQEMGNKKGREIYEAYLPSDFRRPQSDYQLEGFIRDKYERKKYLKQGWTPPQPKSSSNSSSLVDEKKERKKTKLNKVPLQLNSTARPKSVPTSNGEIKTPQQQQSTRPVAPATAAASSTVNNTATQQKKQSASVDLLGLDTPQVSSSASLSPGADPFGDFLAADSIQPSQPSNNTISSPDKPEPDSSLFDVKSSAEKPKSTKESIMALYGSSSSQQQQQQQVYGVPGGMYMPQQQQNMTQMNMMANMQGNMPGGMQNGMAPNNMMAYQQNMQQQPQGNMMMGLNQAGMMQGNVMMQQGQMPNMAMYGLPQQQNQMQQVQQQMGAMKLGGQGMMGIPQQTAGTPGWPAQQSVGGTLSNNLWQ